MQVLKEAEPEVCFALAAEQYLCCPFVSCPVHSKKEAQLEGFGEYQAWEHRDAKTR